METFTANGTVEGKLTRRKPFCFAILILAGLFLASPIPAQIPQPKPAPLAPSGSEGCSVEKSCAEVAPGMIQSALGPSPLEENLRHLTDTIGGRVTGSPAARKATAWAVEAFRRAGVDEVHTEKFTIPVGWSEGRTHVEILSPVPFSVHLVSNAWTPPTPEGGIKAEVVDVGIGDVADLCEVAEEWPDVLPHHAGIGVDRGWPPAW